MMFADCEREQAGGADDVARGEDAAPIHARRQPRHWQYGESYECTQSTQRKIGIKRH